MSKEAMKLALEALEKLVRFESDSWELGSCRISGQAIKALREALAEQPAPVQQEPVAYLVDGDLYYPEEIDWETLQEQGHTVAPLYTKEQP